MTSFTVRPPSPRPTHHVCQSSDRFACASFSVISPRLLWQTSPMIRCRPSRRQCASHRASLARAASTKPRPRCELRRQHTMQYRRSLRDGRRCCRADGKLESVHATRTHHNSGNVLAASRLHATNAHLKRFWLSTGLRSTTRSHSMLVCWVRAASAAVEEMEVETAVGSSERTLALAQGPPAPPPEPSPPPPPPPPLVAIVWSASCAPTAALSCLPPKQSQRKLEDASTPNGRVGVSAACVAR